MKIATTLSGIFFWAFIIAACVLGVCFMLVPLLPILFISKSLFRSLVDNIVTFYIIFVTAVIETMYGMKVVVSGDIFAAGRNSLVLMNHRTRLDWFFFWCCLYRHGYKNIVQEKISLKHPLKFLPGLGWATQLSAFMYLKRKWDSDQILINDMLRYYQDVKMKVHLLFFPEGTDMCPNAIERSNAYSDKEGVARYQYLLHPRTTGFSYLYRQMLARRQVDTVYDVTVAYNQVVPQNESDLMHGKFPEEIHFHIREHRACDLPTEDSDLQIWCKDIFRAKEDALKTFYTCDHKFPGATSASCTSLSKSLQIVTLIFWSFFTSFAIYAVLTSYLVLGYLIFCATLFSTVGRKLDGFDILQMNL